MKIYIETYGCSANQSNSEIMAGFLAKTKHELVPENKADLIIINTCTVKTPTERKILRRIRELHNQKKKVLVGGCMAEVQRNDILKAHPKASIMSLFSTSKIVEIVDKIEEGFRVIRLKDKREPLLCLPKLRINQVINIVQIAEGCVGDCNYCVVKYAKKGLTSFPLHLIISDIQNSVKEGCKEIWITSQDTAAYGIDNGFRLPALLRKITTIPGNHKIRIGMMNPANVLPMLNDLIIAYKHPKIYRFLHLPVQSGSDEVLEAMNRKYTVDEFKKIYYAFKKQFPDLTFSTDIIVGYPGETEEDFKKTLKLIEEIKPDIVNISMYGKRPHTKVEEKEVPPFRIKERSRKLTEIVNKIKEEKNKKWIKWEGEVLISQKGSKGGFIARNYVYKPILLNKGKLGEFSRVSIVDARTGYLVGK